MLSVRSKLSLCQLLELLGRPTAQVLFEKHGLSTKDLGDPEYITSVSTLIVALGSSLSLGSPEQVQSLLLEVLRTREDLRYRVVPRYRFDTRWNDLIGCLELDGYKWDGQSLTMVDPTIAGAEPVDDDLSAELKRSGLPEATAILQLLENSAEAFRNVPPEFNACLSEARVALQTLATAIARVRRSTIPGTFDETKWGQVVTYLRTSGLVTSEEERGLTGVFTFVSPGAHKPIGLSNREATRLGRSFAAGMAYFLVKRHNG